MSKRTVRANARPMSQSLDHADAAIFALAEECVAARKVVDDASDLMEKLDDVRAWAHELNPALQRTERDKQLGLYVGNRGGGLYSAADVPVLRALVLENSVLDNRSSKEDFETWERASAILDALREKKVAGAKLDAKSGRAEATRRYNEARDAHEDLLERLVKTPAKTIDGAFAKARGMRGEFVDDHRDLDEVFDDKLRENMRRLGPDDQNCALSLARDLIQLAAKEKSDDR